MKIESPMKSVTQSRQLTHKWTNVRFNCHNNAGACKWYFVFPEVEELNKCWKLILAANLASYFRNFKPFLFAPSPKPSADLQKECPRPCLVSRINRTIQHTQNDPSPKYLNLMIKKATHVAWRETPDTRGIPNLQSPCVRNFLEHPVLIWTRFYYTPV